MEATRDHRTMNNVLEYLADRWHIGMLSAFVAWGVSTLNFMFDEDILRIVGGIGIYIGVFVASLTALLKLFDVIDRAKKWFKRS